MKQTDQWRPSKYAVKSGIIRPSSDRRELMPSSRVMTSLVAEFYTRAIPLWAGGDLADLGCGKAPLLSAYSRYCDSVLLVDWENSEHPNPLLDITLDLNRPLTAIDSESLDTVLLSDVLEHIREPAGLLAEISRILRPGGHLIMNVPFTYRLHEQPHDYYRYTSHALEYLMTAAGLELIEVIPLGGWLEIMADMWGKLFSAARIPMLAAIIHRVAITIGRTPPGRKFTAMSGAVSPLGYGLSARKPMVVTMAASGTDR